MDINKKRKILGASLFLFFTAYSLQLTACKTFAQHSHNDETPKVKAGQQQKDIYYCPMHPSFTSDKPGDCPVCGMTLVKKEKSPTGKGMAGDRKVLYYRNPMDPAVTSSVAMKDSMGMDYVPVYAEESKLTESGVYISSEKQQAVGVKKEKVEKRALSRQISTVGRVAYDPGLYAAQEEYLAALKVKEQVGSLAEAAEKKLLLLGMNKQEIEELAKRARAQANLYLPQEEDTVWVYAAVYEYEADLVKEGLSVEIEAIAVPGEIFSGKVIAIKPVLDAMTRSLEARIEVENKGHKLKPEMFVNVKINIGLGERLAVSEEAVINTGKRTLVVVSDGNNNFFSREVKLGQKAEGYYEVLEGLDEGQVVVTSGNFLIDSESRLQSAISSEHNHGQ